VAKDLLALPFILPEPDAACRQQFDDWMFGATGQLLDVVLEAGGWQAILGFATAGLGVGFVTESAFAAWDTAQQRKLTCKRLAATQFPPDAVRLITRKSHGVNLPELSMQAEKLKACLQAEARRLEPAEESRRRH
jgi:DNA-binding transcriptional LysR family regulator